MRMLGSLSHSVKPCCRVYSSPRRLYLYYHADGDVGVTLRYLKKDTHHLLARLASTSLKTYSELSPLITRYNITRYCTKQDNNTHQGLYSLSGRTSYRKISWSLEAARFGFRLFLSLRNLTSNSAGRCAAELPVKCRSDTIIVTSNLAASRLHEIWQ